MSEEKPTKNELIQEGIAATTRQAIRIGKQAQEIKRLKAQVKELEEKLSELQKGLPIEKADKRKRYQYNCLGDILIVRWHETSNCWLYYCEEDESDKEFIETHVFPLPSTETQMEGE